MLYLSSIAQPVINSANVQTGQTFDLYTLTNPGTSDPSPTGANINYDFSSATITMVGTATISDNQSSPYAATYPTGNIAYHIQVPLAGVDEWAIFNNSSTKIDQLASGLGGSDPVHYTETRSLIEYPFQYNTSFTDTYTKQGQSQVTVTRTYDAYGSLQTSVQDFPSIIRISDSQGYLQFWNASPLHPIVEIDGSDVTVWIPSTANGLQSPSLAKISCYPNPATDFVQLQLSEAVPTTISIATLNGTLVHAAQSTQLMPTLDISTLRSGVYFITISNAAGSQTLPLIKQ